MKKLTHQEFLIRAYKVHNNKYIYNENYIKSHLILNIECKIHSNFKQTPHNHLSGQGCPKCADINNGIKNRIGLDLFIEKSNKIHNFKYKYIGPYITIDTKTKITCDIHGIFEQTPRIHLSGSGCSNCGIDLRSIKRRKSQNLFIEQANLVHNFKYKYIGTYINSKTKYEIECPIHGIFKQHPTHHLNGEGCPKCVSSISKSEIKWFNYLNIKEEYRQKTIIINNKKYKVDAFDPTINTVYEFYGDFWHGNPIKFNENEINDINRKTFGELYQATLKREQLIKQAGYNLVFIWENDWKKLNKRVINE